MGQVAEVAITAAEGCMDYLALGGSKEGFMTRSTKILTLGLEQVAVAFVGSMAGRALTSCHWRVQHRHTRSQSYVGVALSAQGFLIRDEKRGLRTAVRVVTEDAFAAGGLV